MELSVAGMEAALRLPEPSPFGQTIAGFTECESAACIAQAEGRGRHKEKTAGTTEKRLIFITYTLFARLLIKELPFEAECKKPCSLKSSLGHQTLAVFSTEATMGEERQPMPFVDATTKVLTLLSLGIAVFAAWRALPVDEEIKRLQAQAQEIEIALKKADSDLKGLESSRKVTLELYQEVKDVIAKKDKDPREEDAVRVLVESLADDPFRWKLLKVLAVGASSSAVKQAAAATSEFYEYEATVQSQLAVSAKITAAGVSADYGSFCGGPQKLDNVLS